MPVERDPKKAKPLMNAIEKSLNLTGAYHVRRQAILEVFVIGNVAKTQEAINEFLANLTDPGWQFHWTFTSGPNDRTLSVLAVLDTLEQDVEHEDDNVPDDNAPVMPGNRSATPSTSAEPSLFTPTDELDR